MRVLVTGSQGFAGQHVVHDLEQAGHEPIGLVRGNTPVTTATHTSFQVDLRDASTLKNVVSELRPDACIHLAGIAFVPRGWTEPALVFNTNVLGTINLLEAFKEHARQARILVVTSAEVYGHVSSNTPLGEEAPLGASNLYAVSKMAADLASLMYAQKFGMHVMTARPQNHVGPGQSSAFVISAFANQLANIVKFDQAPKLTVGNLDSERFFLDVRDVAKAYRLITERGSKGHAYNVGTTRKTSIRAALDALCKIAQVEPVIEMDPAKFRPTESPPLLDTRKLSDLTSWEPEFSLNQTLEDVYQEILADL